MTGSLPMLKNLLSLDWQEYVVLSARKDMKYCRDTCAVYQDLGKEADLSKLEGGQKEYNSHRRVFDGATNLLKAEVRLVEMTEKQLTFYEAIQRKLIL